MSIGYQKFTCIGNLVYPWGDEKNRTQLMQKKGTDIQFVSNMVAIGRPNEKKIKEKDPNAQTADFIRFTAFGKTAEMLIKYQQKGKPIGLEGRIQIDRVEANGSTAYYTKLIVEKMIFLGNGNGNGNGTPAEEGEPVDSGAEAVDMEYPPF